MLPEFRRGDRRDDSEEPCQEQERRDEGQREVSVDHRRHTRQQTVRCRAHATVMDHRTSPGQQRLIRRVINRDEPFRKRTGLVSFVTNQQHSAPAQALCRFDTLLKKITRDPHGR